MNLAEFTATLIKELKDAGFDVSEHAGFPIVKRPEKLEDGVRLLKFATSIPCERHIYAEGMIFFPFGTGNLMKQWKPREWS